MKVQSKFEEFERKVIEKLLNGEDNILKTLRNQYRKANIKNREFSGSGFFTTFDVPDDATRLEILKSFHFGDVLGQCDGVKDGIGFVLFIKNGAMNCLEGYTYGDDKWPETLENYQLSYSSGAKRDLDKLREKWGLV
ncbi:hypothetical protein [Methylomusa anaerophila]|uniref:Uncharacterized protein n=1 Tax=Methylomusa anaerophila TaxID=1930071 RepID=A0A348AHB6_9FIRM|nr:hypothetical protein [Methylomusa anaerophila]BBB90464.1 hypothetical protein MAMMFC1_01115 [Methylomusa anaerophila]